MITITRKFTFDAAHRVLGHESKCKFLHGHTYTAEVTVTGPKLDALGRIVDFGILKTEVGKWIDDHWDHNTLLNLDDPLCRLLIDDRGKRIVKEVLGADDHWLTSIFGRAPYIMPDGLNPTAENIAKVLAEAVSALFQYYSIAVTHVRIWETPNCYADYYLPC